MYDDKPPLQGKCPNCRSRLERSIEIFDGISVKGPHIYRYKCPNCDYVFKRRFYTPPLELSIAKSVAKLSGDLGENVAFKILSKKSFELMSFRDLVSELGDNYKTFVHENFSDEYLKEFFGKKPLQNFIKYCRAWTEDSEVPSGKIREKTEWNPRFRSSHFGPDWIGKKDGKFYVIEVKTNRAILQKYQKKMLLKAKEFGFIPLIVRVKVELKVPLEEVKIVEL